MQRLPKDVSNKGNPAGLSLNNVADANPERMSRSPAKSDYPADFEVPELTRQPGPSSSSTDITGSTLNADDTLQNYPLGQAPVDISSDKGPWQPESRPASFLTNENNFSSTPELENRPAASQPATMHQTVETKATVRKRRLVLAVILGLVVVVLTALTLVVTVISRDQLNLLTWWVNSPLAAFSTILLIAMLALRELLADLDGKFAGRVNRWLDILIPQLLFIFIIILAGRLDIILSTR